MSNLYDITCSTNGCGSKFVGENPKRVHEAFDAHVAKQHDNFSGQQVINLMQFVLDRFLGHKIEERLIINAINDWKQK